MGTIANAKVTHYYNCYNGDFIGCLPGKKLLYLHIDMAKFLRFIGFMVLALALWQTVSDTFANKAASGGNVVSENTIAVHEQTDAYIAMPQLPYLPDAELAGMGGQLHSLTYSRIQRISTTEYIFSLKDWIDKLAQRAAVLSLHREKLYDATAYYRCQPVCEYYIFTLRRILI